MQILSPAALWLALLCVIPVILYLVRRKSKTVEVSTLVFFKSLAKEHQEAAWLRKLKKFLSLLLTLAVLLGIIFALARILFAPAGTDSGGVVIALDRSASMLTSDPELGSRLPEAIDQLTTRIEALPADLPVALIAYDRRPEIIVPRTTNRRALLRALKEISPRPLEDNRAAALAAAGQIAALQTPSEVWLVSDRTDFDVTEEDLQPEEETPQAPPEALPTHLPEGVSLVPIPIGSPTSLNAGITAFRIRPVPLEHGRFEAYVQVAAAAGHTEPITLQVEARIGGQPVQIRELELEPSGSEGLLLPIDGAQGQLLEVETLLVGDTFPTDDHVLARLPEVRPVLCSWISATDAEDPFTRLALNALAEEGELDIYKGTPESWPPAQLPDVAIFDGWLPEEWPENLPAIVINPPNALGPVQAVPLNNNGIPHPSVRVADAHHPLLFRVTSSRIALTQTAILESDSSLQPLWFAGNEPVLLAGEAEGTRLVLMGFSPQRSENLPLSASFPLLIGNALLWCAESRFEELDNAARRTGELIAAPKGEIQWEELRGSSLATSTQTTQGSLAELDRIGLWDDGDGHSGSALLLSSQETVLSGTHPTTTATATDPNTTTPAASAAPRSKARFLRGELSTALLWIVLAILLIESYLFHRRSVY